MIPASTVLVPCSVVTDEKRKRLSQRKRAMFLRAHSLDCIYDAWGQSQSPPPSPAQQRTSINSKPGQSPHAMIEPEWIPLLAQRWATQQHNSKTSNNSNANNDNTKSDKAPLCPSSRPSRGRGAKVASQSPDDKCSADIRASRSMICRWDSESSLDIDTVPKPQSRSRQLSPDRKSRSATW